MSTWSRNLTWKVSAKVPKVNTSTPLETQEPASENSAAMGSTGTARNGGGLYAAADAEMMDAEAPADLAKPVKDIEDKWKLLPRQVNILWYGKYIC